MRLLIINVELVLFYLFLIISMNEPMSISSHLCYNPDDQVSIM